MPAVLEIQLSVPYRRESWSALLGQIFGDGVEVFLQPKDVRLTNESERRLATGFRQFGRASLGDGKIVGFFEVDASPNVELVANRVGLRSLVSRRIDEITTHAVLAFFVQPGMSTYRLTYAAKESVINVDDLSTETQETSARRFTYVLGPNEPVRTAAQRLSVLAEKRDAATLADVTEAFSVEKLNKEFFDLYKEHYEEFCRYLIEESDAVSAIFGIEVGTFEDKPRGRALKPVRDFVKKLLGRVVFLHFLQKKGWLGCDPNTDQWTGGDPQFLRHLFDGLQAKEHFYSKRLVPLFFHTLNQPNRPEDLFPVTGTRIPYLNGGLFEPDRVNGDGDVLERIDFPAQLFDDLLAFFAHYNFTIDENDPEENEIGIDPEMLGHIFENLLEDNKDKGAYYTPKPVVQYMCQQSLIHYLRGQFAEEPAATEIERLIRHKEPIDAKTDSWLTQNLTRIEQLLDEVKICDPAIGSGAFPIGLLQEIYWTKLTLHPALDRAEAKRGIIQRSIHGVDIDAGAVEIARLRCWLALIVDEKIPLPLPNLDYQIMQGNSLLESFEGIDLSKLDNGSRPGHSIVEILGDPQGQLLADEARAQMEMHNATRRDEISSLIYEYFALHDPDQKAECRRRIDALAVEHIRYNLGYRRDEIETQLQQQRETLRGQRVRKRGWSEAGCRRAITRLESELGEIGGKEERLRELEQKPERPFFLWHLWFREVFEGKGGFDIVIANPPYGAEFEPAEAAALRENYATIANSLDSFILFMEQASDLLTVRGILSFIVPGGWVSTPSSRKLRALFACSFHPITFASLPYDVFGEAYVDTMIVAATRLARGEAWATIVDKSVNLIVFPVRYRVIELADFRRFQKSGNFDLWGDPSEDGFLVTSSLEETALVAKLRKMPKQFGHFIEVMRGIETYHPRPTARLRNARRALVGDIYRYEVNHTDHGFISYPPDVERGKPWRFFSGPRLLLRQLLSRRFRLQAGYAEDDFLTNQSVQSLLARSEETAPIKVMLAVLNSTLISWYFCQINMVARRDDFPKTIIKVTRELPIPDIALPEFATTRATLLGLVDDMLAAKRSADVGAVERLEQEIDTCVYRLYELTPEEIAIVQSPNGNATPKI